MLSDVLLGIIIFLVIVVITFVATVFWPKPKCFFNYKKYYPFLASIEKSETHKQIMNEVEAYLKMENLTNIGTSKDIDIYCLFSGTIINNLNHLPVLSSNLAEGISEQKIKNVYICVLGPDMRTKHENTAAKLSNHTLRAVLLTEAFGECKVWCDGETKILNSNIICYDHSRQNSIQNENFYDKITFLIIDLERPQELPVGISKTTGECPLC
jgi:hypothetical protein